MIKFEKNIENIEELKWDPFKVLLSAFALQGIYFGLDFLIYPGPLLDVFFNVLKLPFKFSYFLDRFLSFIPLYSPLIFFIPSKTFVLTISLWHLIMVFFKIISCLYSKFFPPEYILSFGEHFVGLLLTTYLFNQIDLKKEFEGGNYLLPLAIFIFLLRRPLLYYFYGPNQFLLDWENALFPYHLKTETLLSTLKFVVPTVGLFSFLSFQWIKKPFLFILGIIVGGMTFLELILLKGEGLPLSCFNFSIFLILWQKGKSLSKVIEKKGGV